MGETPNLLLPYPDSTDPADVPVDMQQLADRLDVVIDDLADTVAAFPGRPPLVTSLPDPPTDGQEVYYQADAANGVIWHLRYRAGATTYKWERVGGAPLHVEVEAGMTINTITYGDFATVGPQLTAPLAGVYDIAGAAYIDVTASNEVLMAAKIGAAATIDADLLARARSSASAAAANSSLGGRPIRRTIATPGSVIKAQYRLIAAGSGNVASRVLELLPVRVA